MVEYVARRRALINGIQYEPGEVVPEAERIQTFRALVSAGFLVKRENVGPPPPTSPADPSPATEGVSSEAEVQEETEGAETPETAAEAVTATEAETTTEASTLSQVEGAEQNDVDVQRQSVEQSSGRSEVPNRGHEGVGPASVKRGNTVRVSTVRK